MTSRSIRLLCVPLLLVLPIALVGASGDDEAAGTTSLDLWVLAGPQTTMYQSWTSLYEAQNPNVKFNLTSQEAQSMIDLMTSALASGSEALDISFYWGGAAVDNWARDGLLLDLSEITRDNQWFDKKNVGSQGYATDDLGNFYFTTDWVTVPHYFYRTDIFEKVGISAPRTMDEFFSNGAKLKAAGYEAWSAGVVDRWPIGGVFNDILARVMPQQEFLQFVNWERNPNRSESTAEVLRHPAAVEAWGYIELMIDEGLFVTGANAMDDATARQLFINGTTAMYDSGSWTMGIFTNDAPDLSYDYFNLPPINGNVSIPSGYNGLIVPAYVDQAKVPAIVDFLNASFGTDFARAVFEVGSIPDNTTIDAADFSDSVHPLVLRILDDVKTHGDVGIIDALQSPPLRQGYYDTIAALFEGNISPQEAAERMYQDAVATLE